MTDSVEHAVYGTLSRSVEPAMRKTYTNARFIVGTTNVLQMCLVLWPVRAVS